MEKIWHQLKDYTIFREKIPEYEIKFSKFCRFRSKNLFFVTVLSYIKLFYDQIIEKEENNVPQEAIWNESPRS